MSVLALPKSFPEDFPIKRVIPKERVYGFAGHLERPAGTMAVELNLVPS